MKYRATDKMPKGSGFKPGDIVEYDPETGSQFVSMGFLEPLEMDEAKQDTQLRQYRRKAT